MEWKEGGEFVCVRVGDHTRTILWPIGVWFIVCDFKEKQER
jgi:hypothetical protein